MNPVLGLAAGLLAPVMGGALNEVWKVALLIVFFLSALLLILIVLLQEGKGGGLAAALGGQGAETFGVATGGVNKVTMTLVGLFLLTSLLYVVADRRTVVDEVTGEPGKSSIEGGGGAAGEGAGGTEGGGGSGGTEPPKSPETPEPPKTPEKPAETPAPPPEDGK